MDGAGVPDRRSRNCPSGSAELALEKGVSTAPIAGRTMGEEMHTQVAIIGAGPAGLFLSHLLYREGIACVVLEARSRAYVEDRVRAGVLEQGTVDLMHELGLDQRLRRECMIDEAIGIRFRGKLIHISFPELVAGKVVTIYGQQ